MSCLWLLLAVSFAIGNEVADSTTGLAIDIIVVVLDTGSIVEVCSTLLEFGIAAGASCSSHSIALKVWIEVSTAFECCLPRVDLLQPSVLLSLLLARLVWLSSLLTQAI